MATNTKTSRSKSTTVRGSSRKPAQTAQRAASTSRSTAGRTTAATRSTARRTTSSRATASSRGAGSRGTGGRGATRRTATSTQPKTRVEAAQVLAERAVLVPVGASLMARDNLVLTVKGLATKYRTRASVEREVKRYERRGASARNRFERQVRRTRTKFERELRQRRTTVERTVKQNRGRVEREVRSVRKDLGKQSGSLGARVEKLVTDAQGRIGSLS